MKQRVPRTSVRTPIFLLAYMIMLFGVIYLTLSKVENGTIAGKSGDSLVYQSIWLMLYLILLARLAANANVVATILSRCPLLFIFLISASLSYINLPPQDPTSIVKFGMYFMTILFGLWLSISVSVDLFFTSVYALGIAIIFAHWAAYPFVADTMIYDLAERKTVLGTLPYGGLFGHKNLAGAYFGFSTLLAATRFLVASGRPRRRAALFALANFATLVATGAVGPLVSVFGAGSLMLGAHLLSRRSLAAPLWWYSIIAGSALVGLIGYVGLLNALGREANFTGRSFLLETWPHFFFQHPFLGYGFAGFFTAGPDSYGAQLSAMKLYSNFGTFESSYLEASIAFGLLGGIPLISILFTSFLTSWRFLFQHPSAQYGLAPVTTISFIILSSLSDTDLMLHNHFYIAIVFWGYFGLRNGPVLPHLRGQGRAMAHHIPHRKHVMQSLHLQDNNSANADWR